MLCLLIQFVNLLYHILSSTLEKTHTIDIGR